MQSPVHLCLLYLDSEGRAAALASFLQEGVARGERCFVAHRGPAQELIEGLAGAGFRARDSVTFVRAERLELSRQPERLIRRALRGPDPARIAFDFGATDSGVLGWERALHRESAGAALLCQFDFRSLSDRALADRVGRHAWLLLGDRLCPSPPVDFPERTRALLEWLLEGAASRRQLELQRAQLERREKELASLVDNTPDDILRLDRDHRALYVNTALARHLGVPGEALLGSSMRTLDFPEPGRTLWPRAVDQVFETGAEAEFEFHVDGPGGRLWKHARLVAERGREGVASVLAVVRDVTAQKQLEEELRLRFRQLRVLFELSSLLQGSSTEEAACEVAAELLPLLGREGRPLRAWIRPASEGAALQLPVHGNLAVHVEEPEGLLPEERAVLEVAADRVGEALRRIEAERERTRGEERLQALVESASDMIWILTPDAVVRYVAPSVERVLGYPPEAIVGTSGYDWVHPEDHEAARAALSGCIENPQGTARTEIRARDRRGDWRTVEAMVTNRLDDPAVGGVVVNSRDITERRRLEAQLLQSQKMEAIGRLAGGVAHDFNNLLTVIAGGAELLAQREPRLAGELEEILGAARRAASLTRQLLAFSRQQVVQYRTLDLDALLAEMEPMVRSLMGVDIEVATRLQLGGACVRADRGQLEQVVMNLVLNARDAMPHGGRLAIATELLEGGWLRLLVEDTGTGISDEAQPRIFEPFFTTREGGTGLGLSTVYGIVEASGGITRFDSRTGEGTRFEVHLPGVACRADGRAVPAAGQETILAVDDEPVVRRIARRILEQSGYRVLDAGSGEAALEIAGAYDGPIHLLLSDLVMPKLNGWELAERLLRRRPGTRMLFMSGYTADTVLDPGMLERGEITFLEKPFGPDELLRTVREVLDRRLPDPRPFEHPTSPS